MELVGEIIDNRIYKDIAKEIKENLNNNIGMAIRVTEIEEIDIIIKAIEKEGILSKHCNSVKGMYEGKDIIIEPCYYYYDNYNEIYLSYDNKKYYYYYESKRYKHYIIDKEKKKLKKISKEEFWKI